MRPHEKEWESALTEIADFAGTDLRDMVRAKVAALEAANARLRLDWEDAAQVISEITKPALGVATDEERRALMRPPTPGELLLERIEAQHRKALVRARNEGLERAAQHLEHVAEGHPSNPAASALSYAAIEIGAMKETEG